MPRRRRRRRASSVGRSVGRTSVVGAVSGVRKCRKTNQKLFGRSVGQSGWDWIGVASRRIGSTRDAFGSVPTFTRVPCVGAMGIANVSVILSFYMVTIVWMLRGRASSTRMSNAYEAQTNTLGGALKNKKEKRFPRFCRVVYGARRFGVVLRGPPPPLVVVERRAASRLRGRGDPSLSEEDREVELLRAHDARDPTSRHQQ